MPELIELQEYPVKDYLADLLKDKTTGKNILFATEAYQVEKTEEMSVERLTQFEKYVIQPRVSKTISEQAERTRNKAEVFTPSWICQKMNDTYDEIIHSDEWQNYIQSTVLEITCGEAPYLVSRYDTATGETIPIEKRIGILDRKLKIVNEHTKTMKSWIEWTNKAFRSVYGYEFQGDSLLIARINLLMTFVEYYRDRWGCDPTENQLNTIVGIICRNLWQMDGLTRQIPFTENEEGFIGSFFDI
ncbi:MAG: restriction endonuclease subunit M, partial [Oscillospiraceae bacterium]|nr:restriction endonuclease subunit M [Oscillospiraceae bacterium]